MTVPKDQRYVIEDRQMIAETPDLRVQILTLAAGEEVPWHFHTNVADTFACLDGPMVVQTKTGCHELVAGDTLSVPAGTPHQVAGKDGGRCRFLIVQGVGTYDYIPTED